MAVKDILVDLNMGQNELNLPVIDNEASAPSGVGGQMYYDTGTNIMYFHNGTTWVSMSTDSETVTDIVGAMVSGNTETGITVTFEDGDDTLDFVVGSLDTLPAPVADLDLNSNKIINLSTPTADNDAANKAYVDGVASGLDVKDSVRAATSAAGTLASDFENGDTVGGVVLATNDRILIKDQGTASENGIYTVNASGAPTRATDADTDAEVTAGMFTFVEEGDHADTGWVLTTDNPIVVDTTALSFSQFSGAGSIVAGDGLDKTGSTLSVNIDTRAVGTATTEITSDEVRVASTWAGHTALTTLGTVTTGTWEATDVGVSHGGTGASTAAGARTNLDVPGRYTETIGDGGTTNFTVTHNLGTRDVVVSIYEAASPYAEVEALVEKDTTAAISVEFNSAPASNEYVVAVIG